MAGRDRDMQTDLVQVDDSEVPPPLVESDDESDAETHSPVELLRRDVVECFRAYEGRLARLEDTADRLGTSVSQLEHMQDNPWMGYSCAECKLRGPRLHGPRLVCTVCLGPVNMCQECRPKRLQCMRHAMIEYTHPDDTLGAQRPAHTPSRPSIIGAYPLGGPYTPGSMHGAPPPFMPKQSTPPYVTPLFMHSNSTIPRHAGSGSSGRLRVTRDCSRPDSPIISDEGDL